MTEPSFRTAVAEVQPAVRTLTDLELREIQDRTPATVATKTASAPELSQLSQLSQPYPAEIAASPDDLRDQLEERAALIFEGYTRTLGDDGTPLAEPTFGLSWAEAERLARADVLGGAA